MTRRTTLTEVADWIEGRLPAERAQQVADAVRDDQDAADAAAWVADFLATAQRLRLETPPPGLGVRLRGLLDGSADLDQPREESRARLLYDTRTTPAPGAAAVPGADGEERAHLAFASEVGRFVVEIGPVVGAAVELRGLLLATRSPALAEVTLLERGVVRGRCRCAADGAFAFEDVPVTVDEIHVQVDGLGVGAQIALARS